MATHALESRTVFSSAQVFGGLFLLACALLAIVIGLFPLGASIVTIFVFAGLHNFFEFRYFAARMPVRWGRSTFYYAFGIGGVVVLASAYGFIYFASGTWPWSAESWEWSIASWNSAFVVWVASLVYLRGRHRSGRDWSWAFPVAFFVAALAWLVPSYWSLSLVYIHPLVALWFLERQIRRTRKEWLRTYHVCLLSIPIFVATLFVIYGGTPDLPGDTNLFWRITEHAGAGILPRVSSHFLVSVHVFLESVHYSVWILMLPLIDRRAIPWRLGDVPLFASPKGFPKLFAAFLIVSACIVVAFWFGFSIDYATTRDIYFGFAIAHVLAEFPFLVKML